jgi:hypothetical protein
LGTFLLATVATTKAEGTFLFSVPKTNSLPANSRNFLCDKAKAAHDNVPRSGGLRLEWPRGGIPLAVDLDQSALARGGNHRVGAGSNWLLLHIL